MSEDSRAPSARVTELEEALTLICGAFPTKLILNGGVDKVCAELRAKYAVVPREPTQVMKDAGVSPAGRQEYGWPLDDYLYHETFFMQPDIKADAAGLIYRAMIEAAGGVHST
jgi:hypothetical protein